MELILIIIGSVIVGIAVISYLLSLFVRKVLHNNNTVLARVMVGLLTLQFILGMLANLYVTIPKVAPYDVWHHLGPVVFHSVNALILIILSVIFLIRAIKEKNSVIIGSISVICISLATYSGVTFVLTGQMDIYSLIMSMGFIVVLLLYAWKAFSGVTRVIS
jgi:hypothetical protein